MSENGQRYTQQWGAETVGYNSNVVIANDWVTCGSASIEEVGSMYSLVCISPLTAGTSAALCYRMN